MTAEDAKEFYKLQGEVDALRRISEATLGRMQVIIRTMVEQWGDDPDIGTVLQGLRVYLKP